jgi:competence protein ComEC
LPAVSWYVPLALIALLGLRHRSGRWLIWAIAGFAWTAFCADQRLADRLPRAALGQDVPLSGWVDGFPSIAPGQVTFSFAVDEPRPKGVPARIRLTWYEPPVTMTAGASLTLVARLKPPRGLRNPGGFDYERWLLLAGYGATGYVRSGAIAANASPSLRRSWLLFRAGIAERLDAAAPNAAASALLTALSIGERFRFSEQHWSDFRLTGTSHLVAVSGMHVGLIGLLIFLGLRWLWIRLPSPLASYDLEAAAFASAAATLYYAALTGFAVPAQRSLLMIVVALVVLASRRYVAPCQGLAAALLLVLLWDPFAPLSASFWLSFVAVGLLLLLAAPRSLAERDVPGRAQRLKQSARALINLQWGISLALLPLTAVFFAEVSLISPFVNLVAIPLFNLVLVPLTLLATLLLPFETVGHALVHAVGLLASGTLLVIHEIATLQWAALRVSAPAPWAVVLAGSGVLLGIRAHPLAGRRLAWLALLPMFAPWLPKLPAGAAKVVLLDVGHGLAVLIETREHRLLFDAGPSYPSGFDSGDEIAIPALASRGRRGLDRMIVSHADNDHAGGAAAIVRAFPDVDVLVGPDVVAIPAARCEQGQHWVWDDVEFSVLHPPAKFGARGNDSSCVLKITTPTASLLITGDIESRGESSLQRQADVAADIVIVPHHGSATSSSASFVEATGAQLALVSAGHANRWGFPKPEVRQRWERNGAAVVVTGVSGAVTAELGEHGALVSTERDRRRHYWDAES